MTDAVSTILERKIQDAFSPLHVQLVNESHMHAGPRTDSHFKLILVSECFAGQPKVKRHQQVYRTLEAELAGPVHALALHLYTPAEWAAAQVPDSPPCSHAKS